MKNSTLNLFYDTGGKISNIEVAIKVNVKRKEHSWIVFSPDFKTFGYSETDKASALQDFNLALKIFFKVHITRGTLDDALGNLDWLKEDHRFTTSKFKFKLPNLRPQQVQERFDFAY